MKKESLIRLLVEESKSYEEVGRIYGCSGANIKKVALRLGINLKARRSINPKETFGRGIYKLPRVKCARCGKLFIKDYKDKLYCSHYCSCQVKRERDYQLLLTYPEQFKYNTVKRFKSIILEEQNNRCAICGIEPIWNNKPMTLILDHIDGRASNNRRYNLRMICHNCDSQLPTYKSKNKKSDRNADRYGGYKNNK